MNQLTPIEAKSILDQYRDAPAVRGTLTLSGVAAAALDVIGERTGASRMTLASMLVEQAISEQLRGPGTGLELLPERLMQVLERYDLTVLRASSLLPGFAAESVTSVRDILAYLRQHYASTDWLMIDILREVYGVPERWLLGQSDQPAAPWPEGDPNLSVVVVRLSGVYPGPVPKHSYSRVLLIKSDGVQAQNLLGEGAPRVLVAALRDAGFGMRMGQIPCYVPQGEVSLGAPAFGRQGVLGLIELVGEVESISVPAAIYEALKRGDVHPDDVLLSRKDAMARELLLGPRLRAHVPEAEWDDIRDTIEALRTAHQKIAQQ